MRIVDDNENSVFKHDRFLMLLFFYLLDLLLLLLALSSTLDEEIDHSTVYYIYTVYA